MSATDDSNNSSCSSSDKPVETTRLTGRVKWFNNKTGLLGVRTSGQKFAASIRVNGKFHHLGVYADAHLAHDAYLKAKRMMHKGCMI